MSPEHATALLMLFGLITFLIVIRVPVAFALGGASVVTALYLGIPLYNVFTAAASGLNTFTFMAVPFFMIMGQIMSDGNISTRLVQFSSILVGRIRGGTAIVNVLVSMLFGGISGSSVADVSSIGSMIIPAMKEEGYDPEYSVAVTVTSSVQGVIIPPSQNMIFYVIYANAGLSITTMFIAGYLPGILLGLSLLVPTVLIAKKRHYPLSEKRSAAENLKIVREALLGLLTMVIIIVSTTMGIASATEAAAIAAVYALIITTFVYKRMNGKRFWHSMLKAVDNMTMIMLAIATSFSFRYVLSFLKAPLRLTTLLMSMTDNAMLLMFMIVIAIIIMGCFIDMGLMLIMLAPVLVPLAAGLGYNPYHFGIIFILACAIGLVTPPVGNAIILGCNIGKVRPEKTIKDLLPFVGAMVVCTLVLLLFPQISLFLPRITGYIN